MTPTERVITCLMDDIDRCKRKGYPMRRLGYGELVLLTNNEQLFRTIQMELHFKDREFIETRL